MTAILKHSCQALYIEGIGSGRQELFDNLTDQMREAMVKMNGSFNVIWEFNGISTLCFRVRLL